MDENKHILVKVKACFTLREKSPCSQFFWSVFNRNMGKHGPEKLTIRTLFTCDPHSGTLLKRRSNTVALL